MIGDGEQVLKDRRDREATGDTVGDSVGAVCGDDRSRPPRQSQGGCSAGLDAHHLRCGRQALKDMADAGGQRAAAECALVETAIGRYKVIIGRRLRARSLAGQQTEVAIGCAVFNRMLA